MSHSSESLSKIENHLDRAKTHNAQGVEYQNANALDKAEAEYKKAIELNPDYEAAYSNLVSILERQNKIEDARKYVDLTKKLFPEGLFITLNEALVLKREGKLKDALRVLESKKHPSDPMTEIKVRHEKGLIFDRLSEADKAFEQFNDFNAYATQAFGINAHNKALYLNKIERYRAVFTPEFVNSWQNFTPAEKSPVCLMGFVRCGTTLLQHILNAHPSIYASEEVHAFAKVEESLRNSGAPYPELLSSIDDNAAQNLRAMYFQIHCGDPAYEEAEVSVDKYPMLANMSGLVYRLFPEAKFIFIQRHPCDVILSAYMQLFVPNDATVHFYNFEDVVNLYVKFMDLWQAYEEVLPLNVHYVRYEDITANFKAEIEPVLDFIGVKCDDAVMNYDEHARQSNVIFPSYEQVSEKIYTRAAYRWLAYKEHFEPYLERLVPYINRFGYDA